MRRKLIAGNWKMNGDLAELDGIGADAATWPGVDVAICPPFTLIAAAAAARAGGIAIGAQDCHPADRGAHTGCISAPLLRAAGATMTIVGHSERRTDQHETDAEVRAKATAAMAHGLVTILCVGETEARRDAGEAVTVVRAQLDGSMPEHPQAELLVIGYEPVWAVGTGRTPTLPQVQDMHAAIRAWLLARLGPAGADVRILYGGSMNGANAAALLAVENVDGGLIGGASLTAAAFAPIVAAAAACSSDASVDAGGTIR